ncbi:hypothetical protein BC829DRAFT_424248 [Chytridium lagenaria]|nr:hypothetical protein BC829DRAFT_424248 [Chytridium lagenaria]
MSELLQEVRLLREANDRLQATLAAKDLEIRRLTSNAAVPSPSVKQNRKHGDRRGWRSWESSEDKQMALLQANITKSVVSEVMAALDAKGLFRPQQPTQRRAPAPTFSQHFDTSAPRTPAVHELRRATRQMPEELPHLNMPQESSS